MKSPLTVLTLTFLALCSSGFCGDDNPTKPPTWDRLGLTMGAITSTIDGSFRLGLKGSALSVDLEDTLNMDDSGTVVKGSLFWRFTENRRHRLELGWHAFRRDASRDLRSEVTFGDQTFPVGTVVESSFDFDIYQFSYGYSFLQDDRIDLGISAGLFVFPIDFSISTQGATRSKSARFTTALPTIGFYGEVILTPHFRLREGLGLFYVEYEDFSGAITSLSLSAEYVPWRNLALGVGLDIFSLQLTSDSESEDWPGISQATSVNFDTKGIFVYLKLQF